MSDYEPSELEERKPTPLDASTFIASDIASEVPKLEEVFCSIAEELGEATRYMHGLGVDHALSAVLHQANNSLLDGLFDLKHGRGRPALASMRNLFELLVTAHEVTRSSRLADRYLAHMAVVAQLEASLRIESRHLPKRERSADLHRRKKLARDTERDFFSALERYGQRFRREWASETLKTRADHHGLGEGYDSYRLASAVLHGSAGGAVGLRAKIGLETVIRTGPALAVCPLAYLQIFRFYDQILEISAPSLGASILKELRREVVRALKLWPEYRRAVLRIDRRTWPTEPPPPMIPIFAFRDYGKHREWHLLDGHRDQIIEAHPPREISPTLARRLEAIVQSVSETADPGELITVAVAGIRVIPKDGAEWRNPLEVLPPRPTQMQLRRIDLRVSDHEIEGSG